MRRIQYLSIIKQGHIFAALFAVILALAGFSHAANSHKGKKGGLNITSPTEVGGAILQPGDYEVREVNSPSGPVVEFVHLFDRYAPTTATSTYSAMNRPRQRVAGVLSPSVNCLE